MSHEPAATKPTSLRIAVLAFVFSFLATVSLPAQIVTWTLSGTIDTAVNTGGTFNVGDPWSVSFSLNYGTAPGDTGPNYAGYAAATNFVFTSGSYSATQASAAYFYVYNDTVVSFSMDLLEMSIFNPTAPTMNGRTWNSGTFQIQDSNRLALSSTAIPYGVNLADWTNESGGRIVWGTGPTQARIELTLNSVTPTIIPEPATFAAVLAGSILLLTGTARLRRKHVARR